MYLDALGLVSDAQAVSSTGVSTNTIDLGTTGPRIGTGEPVGFGVSVDVAGDRTTGDETYVVQVIQSDNADLSSPDVIGQQTLRPEAGDLAAGALHFLEVPQGRPFKRYLGLRYELGGTTPSITVTAWLTARKLFSIAARAYARGYST